MDCYARSAFKDNLRQHNRVVDQFILEKIKENLPKWKTMASKQRSLFIRQILRDNYVKFNEHGELVYHMEQLYDHLMNFIKPRGMFIETDDEIRALFKKCLGFINSNTRTSKNLENNVSKGKYSQATSDKSEESMSYLESESESTSDSETSDTTHQDPERSEKSQKAAKREAQADEEDRLIQQYFKDIDLMDRK